MNFDALVATLPAMLYGMLGGILVMLVIWVLLAMLYWLSKRGTRNSKEKQAD